jgi:hypothetical protein
VKVEKCGTETDGVGQLDRQTSGINEKRADMDDLTVFDAFALYLLHSGMRNST